MRDGGRAPASGRAARRVAGGARLGAVAALRPGRRRLRVHGPRRQPPARRGRARRGHVGHVLDGRPGPAAHHLRDREGAALPDPVAAGQGAHLVPARARDRRRRPRRDHGRRRREVRRLAGHVRAVLGQGSRGSRIASRRSRTTPTGSPPSRRRRGWPGTPPLGRVYVPDSSYVEMTEWALPPEEARDLPRGCWPRRTLTDAPATPFLRGGAVAQLPGALPRDQRHAQADAARVGGGRCDAGRAARDAALDHLYRGQSNDCYWHGLFGGIYLVHMRMATLAELIAAEDLALARTASRPASPTTTSTASTRCCSARSGRRVLVDVAEGAGIGAGTCARRESRWRRCCAAGPRRTTRPCARWRPHRNAARRPRASSGRASATSARQGERPVSGARLRRPRAPQRPRPDPGHGTAARSATSSAGRGRSSEVSDSRPRRDPRGGRPAPAEVDHARRRPTGSVAGDRGRASIPRTGFDGSVELEMNVNLSGGGGNPDAYYRWAEGEARHDESGAAPADGLHFGNERQGVDVALRRAAADRGSRGRRSRRCRTPRPASSASTRAAACCCAGR